MNLARRMRAKPTITVFWGWIALALVSLVVSLLDGSMHQEMLLAVDYAVSDGSELVQSRADTATSFIYISIVFFVVVNALAALLVHLSAAGSKWAFVLLVPLSLWFAYEALSSPFVLGRMYPGIIELEDWVFAALGGLVWLFIPIHTGIVRRRVAR